MSECVECPKCKGTGRLGVAGQIAGLRRRMGLTQSELASKLGVSHASVSHWETGDRVPADPEYVVQRLERMVERKVS